MGRTKNLNLIKELSKFVNRVKKDFILNDIILFGSRVRGDIKEESDIDLIIVSEGFRNMNFIERAARMYDYWNLDYAVDFLCYTPEEFGVLKERISIASQAIKEGIVLS